MITQLPCELKVVIVRFSAAKFFSDNYLTWCRHKFGNILARTVEQVELQVSNLRCNMGDTCRSWCNNEFLCAFVHEPSTTIIAKSEYNILCSAKNI